MRSAMTSSAVAWRRRRALVAVLMLALAAAVAATAATPTRGPVVNYQAYVGGKGKANPNLSPVVIGWINGQGGPVTRDFPQGTRVIEAAVRMVNAELGGVHKHPVRLTKCFIAEAEEEGVRCGQQMANNRAVKLILFGIVVVGNQSLYATIKGTKPIINGVAANPVDGTAKNAYALNGSQTSVLAPFGTFVKANMKNVKTAAVVYPNQPGADSAANALRTGLRTVGVQVSMIAYPEGQTDLIGVATQAQSADLIVASLGFTDCVPFARAMEQIRSTKPVITPPLCTFFPPAAYASGDLPKWTYGIAQANVHYGPDKEVKYYLKKGLQHGAKVPDLVSVFSQLAWEELLAAVKVMNTIPFSKITPATVSTGFKKFTGPLVMGAPSVACGKVDPAQSAVCGNQTKFYDYLGKGKWKPVSAWLKPPAGGQ
jgi:branched-chain amino acid transport system substrate-binding protein